MEEYLPDGSMCNPDLREARYSRPSKVPSRGNREDRRTETEKDFDRIAYSGYLQRLAGVTQVVSPSLNSSTFHSRLTHSHKVALLAREIATDQLRKARDDDNLRNLILELGGLDLAACAAAGLAHDIGHPPFGHAAEAYLDNWLSLADGEEQPLSDGFEGNAQSIRVVAYLDRRKTADARHGLDLTSVTYAAIQKYPWMRVRGDDTKDNKFNIYTEHEDILVHARKSLPEAMRHGVRQSLEAGVMDLADDITYAVHDLQDFYQVGALNVPHIAQELKSLARRMAEPAYVIRDLKAFDSVASFADSFEVHAAKLAKHYDPYFNLTAYTQALQDVSAWLQSTLDTPYDGSLVDLAGVREAFSQRISDFLQTIDITMDEKWSNGPCITLEVHKWHEIQVMRQLAKSYVVETPAVGLHERAQKAALESIVPRLYEWAHGAKTPRELPQPLHSFIVGIPTDSPQRDTMMRRAVVDYLCTRTDHECLQLARYLSGHELPLLSSG